MHKLSIKKSNIYIKIKKNYDRISYKFLEISRLIIWQYQRHFKNRTESTWKDVDISFIRDISRTLEYSSFGFSRTHVWENCQWLNMKRKPLDVLCFITCEYHQIGLEYTAIKKEFIFSLFSSTYIKANCERIYLYTKMCDFQNWIFLKIKTIYHI